MEWEVGGRGCVSRREKEGRGEVDGGVVVLVDIC